MADYPNGSPTFVTYVDRNLPEGESGTLIGAVDMNKVRDNVLAIITELGYNPRGSFGNVKDRLDDIEGKAHTQGTDSTMKNSRVEVEADNDVTIKCGASNNLQLLDDSANGVRVQVDNSSGMLQVNKQGGISKIYTNAQIECGDYVRSNLGFRYGGNLGVTGDVTAVVALQDNSGTLQYKTQTMHYEGGIITNIGSMSGWIDVV